MAGADGRPIGKIWRNLSELRWTATACGGRRNCVSETFNLGAVGSSPTGLTKQYQMLIDSCGEKLALAGPVGLQKGLLGP